MGKRYILAGYRLCFGLLTVAAVVVQFHSAVIAGSATATNFFSFFTIESNILAAAVFLITGGALLCSNKQQFGWLRGAATLYMVTTGIVYALLLSGLEKDLQTTIPWVNFVVHYLMPLVVFADWLVDLPRHIQIRRALLWLGFPLLYVAYSLVRGPIAGWYPYPFLDPRQHGYAQVAATSVGIAVVMVGLTAVLAKLTTIRPKHGHQAR